MSRCWKPKPPRPVFFRLVSFSVHSSSGLPRTERFLLTSTTSSTSAEPTTATAAPGRSSKRHCDWFPPWNLC